MALVTCVDCGRSISDKAPACPGCGAPRSTSGAAAPASGHTPAEKGVERTLFEDKTVKVTTVRAVVHGKQTYAMSNVTSVSAFIEPKPQALAVFGFFCLGLGLFCVKINVADSSQVGTGGAILGAVLLILYAISKPKHWVRIATAGAETNAIWSHDPAWTQRVVDAISEAIVARG